MLKNDFIVVYLLVHNQTLSARQFVLGQYDFDPRYGLLWAYRVTRGVRKGCLQAADARLINPYRNCKIAVIGYSDIEQKCSSSLTG